MAFSYNSEEGQQCVTMAIEIDGFSYNFCHTHIKCGQIEGHNMKMLLKSIYII